jgi:hypothetical protein
MNPYDNLTPITACLARVKAEEEAAQEEAAEARDAYRADPCERTQRRLIHALSELGEATAAYEEAWEEYARWEQDWL